ncbi:ABC transporter ATP-binding protein [Actinomadura keratinilytica]|jgi:branched-chain amino acid transport system ATP-binding protein|uniref:ABC transporter domain-containing protein n=1 Tax=Actinomadura keratinilytica TaxID=547461 RepID=A0ABP7YWI8_9ACTN
MTAAPVAPELAVTGLTVRFAGLTALDDVGFTVTPGSMHALIGPNGAGKSTCFNVLSGVYRAAAGSVRLGGTELTGLPPHRIAALGVARTFQNLALSPRLSTADNLMLGRHRLTRAGFVACGLRLPAARREERRHRARVAEIAEFVGVAEHLDRPVGLLPYGVQKRVELARALCLEPRVLLLDEPVAGMNAPERRAMAAVLRQVRASLGISILLVEHDMDLVARLADEVTVLDFGRRIATGTPAAVRRDPQVIRAYLGTPRTATAGAAETVGTTDTAGTADTVETAGAAGAADTAGTADTAAGIAGAAGTAGTAAGADGAAGIAGTAARTADTAGTADAATGTDRTADTAGSAGAAGTADTVGTASRTAGAAGADGTGGTAGAGASGEVDEAAGASAAAGEGEQR